MSKKRCTIAPIQPSGDIGESLDKPVNFGCGVILCVVPDWLKGKQITKHLSEFNREQLSCVKFALMVEYDADSLRESKALELITLANLALWIAMPSSIGFDFVVEADFSSNAWSFKRSSDVSLLYPHKKDAANRPAKKELEFARELHLVLTQLPRDGAVWIAIHTLQIALIEEKWPVRYLLFWIVLEVLFGPEDAREMAYRLSQRIAFFLSSNRKEALDLSKVAKDGYGWRSKVVHGMHLTKLTEEKSEEIAHKVENLVWRALNRLLRDPTLVRKFSGKNRESYLDDLVFGE